MQQQRLLLNLLINPERYAGSLSVAGMTDDEWRRTITHGAPVAPHLLPPHRRLEVHDPRVLHVAAGAALLHAVGMRRRRIIELIVRSVT